MKYYDGLKGLPEKRRSAYIGNKFVEFLFPYLLFEVVQENKALLIRDRRKSIVWIFTLQVNDQLRELVILPELAYRVCERFPADYCGKVAILFTVSRLLVSK